MHGAKDSVTCIRRSRSPNFYSSFSGIFVIHNLISNLLLTIIVLLLFIAEIFCDPLGGSNIFYHNMNFDNNISRIEKNSVIVLAARQDSFSMFDGLAPGADSALTSIVVILAVADMINQQYIKEKMKTKKEKSLMFALFDGEAFDYIGSSDTVYKLQNNIFPLIDPKRISFDSQSVEKYPFLNITHLSHFIELNQLGQYTNQQSSKPQLYLHKNLGAPPKLKDLITYVLHESQDLNLTINEIDDLHPLPPSSAHSFLKKVINLNSASINFKSIINLYFSY